MTLREFLTDWLEWAEAGGQGPEFQQRCGLCTNAVLRGGRALQDDLRAAFAANGLNTEIPFANYWTDSLRCTFHLNKQRLAWVRKTLESDRC